MDSAYMTEIAQIFIDDPTNRPRMVRYMIITQFDRDENILSDVIPSEKQVRARISYYKTKFFKLLFNH